MPQLTRGAKILLITNIAMFVLTWLFQYMGLDLTHYLALFFVKSEYFRPYQYVSYMFMHGGLFHLFFNMYALFLFGSMIEYVWGTKRFMFYYIVTGLGAALINTLVYYYQYYQLSDLCQAFLASPTAGGLDAVVQKWSGGFNLVTVYEIIDHWSEVEADPATIDHICSQVSTIVNNFTPAPMVGASGAIFGLLLAFAMMFPDSKLQIIFIPIGIKAKYFVLIFGLLELFLGKNDFASDNVAHWAHLGGLATGVILLLIWKRFPCNNFFNK
ncbi:MAG: rhomboid family intramembrane serine protease [Bacteroidales bacterium]|nr:rhomboid family intramembrane serine protease [Bacteroidales bacterium]